MNLNTLNMPTKAPLTEDQLREGINYINKQYSRAKRRKKVVVRPKNISPLDCSSLYPSGRVLIGAFFVTETGGNRVQSTIKLVCRLHDVRKTELLGECRQFHMVKARRCLAVALRNGGWPLPRIGQLINRDHTSVIHSLNQFKKNADEAERENAAYVSEFYMSYDRDQSADFNNVRCVNELIAGLIASRAGYVKTRLSNKEMLAILHCLLAYLLREIGFCFEEIAAVRACEAKQIEGRCDYIENRCKHQEIHNLKDQIMDRIATLRGAA